jgi:excisionase family DNA binding protein
MSKPKKWDTMTPEDKEATKDLPTLYTARLAAKKLGIPYRMILDAMSSGELEHIRFSSKIRRISAHELMRWMTGLTSKTLSASDLYFEMTGAAGQINQSITELANEK